MTLAIALFALNAQGPLMQGSGFITSRQYENKIYDGNKVIATEWMTLTYTVKWELVESDVWQAAGYFLDCTNICQGKKHKSHETCDLSCDKKCALNHRLVMRGKYEPLYDEMKKARRDSGIAARNSGGTADPEDWTSASTNALREAKRLAEQQVNEPIAHWNDKPCSGSTKSFGRKRWDFKITGTFTKHIVRMESGKKTERDEPGDSHSATVAYVWLPDPNGRVVKEWVSCKCKAEPLKEVPKIVMPNEENCTIPDVIWCKDDGSCYVGDCDPSFRYECVGDDLNRADCQLVDGGGIDHCEVGPGMMCVPDDPECQTMVCTRGAVFGKQPFGHGPYAFSPTAIRVACVEMNKHAPTSRVRFKFVPSNNPGVTNLARKSATARMIGPFDQARLWILTDHATFDQVNKRLIPGVTEGQYLNGLYDVASVGCVDLSSGEYKKCLDADLLIGATASSEAVSWLVDYLSKTDPKSLTSFAKSSAVKFSAALSGAKADRFDFGHAADVASAFCCSQNDTVRSAGLEFCMKAVPESKRAEVINEPLREALRGCINSGNESEAVLAMDVVLAFDCKELADSLRAQAEWGKTDAIRKKASESLAKLVSESAR
jgi:hypothetical protein